MKVSCAFTLFAFVALQLVGATPLNGAYCIPIEKAHNETEGNVMHVAGGTDALQGRDDAMTDGGYYNLPGDIAA